mmetsp:Transcript_92110/g.182934  ORF Transcript_92110/g.182934 Transcript_92110/m.182934 type:complete len:273 (+) Transcript_92110:869-1687(+)
MKPALPSKPTAFATSGPSKRSMRPASPRAQRIVSSLLLEIMPRQIPASRRAFSRGANRGARSRISTCFWLRKACSPGVAVRVPSKSKRIAATLPVTRLNSTACGNGVPGSQLGGADAASKGLSSVKLTVGRRLTRPGRLSCNSVSRGVVLQPWGVAWLLRPSRPTSRDCGRLLPSRPPLTKSGGVPSPSRFTLSNGLGVLGVDVSTVRCALLDIEVPRACRTPCSGSRPLKPVTLTTSNLGGRQSLSFEAHLLFMPGALSLAVFSATSTFEK